MATIKSLEKEIAKLKSKSLSKKRKKVAKAFVKRRQRMIDPLQRALESAKNPAVRRMIQEEIQKRTAKEVRKQVLAAERRESFRQALVAGEQMADAKAKNRAINALAGRAERAEIWATSINEVPFLRRMEFERMDITSPPDKAMIDFEALTVRSFERDMDLVGNSVNPNRRNLMRGFPS